jgi:hypothetical protein
VGDHRVRGERGGAGPPAHAELDAVLLQLELRDVLLFEDPEDLLEVRDVHTRSLRRRIARISKA